MKIVFFVFDGITPLDAVGPFEIFGRMPGAEVVFASIKPGLVRTKGGTLGLWADKALGEVESADLLLIPGGPGTDVLKEDVAVLDWIRKIHETTRWTTSVCTGSVLLAAAGLLKGKRATGHWKTYGDLKALGTEPVTERWVENGRIVTAQGVSAGIDMALWLAEKEAGREVAEAIQLVLEYKPEPPLAAGDFNTADEARISMALTGLNRP